MFCRTRMANKIIETHYSFLVATSHFGDWAYLFQKSDSQLPCFEVEPFPCRKSQRLTCIQNSGLISCNMLVMFKGWKLSVSRFTDQLGLSWRVGVVFFKSLALEDWFEKNLGRFIIFSYLAFVMVPQENRLAGFWEVREKYRAVFFLGGGSRITRLKLEDGAK